MTLIDQRILIPAPAQAVWQILADHRLLGQWRSDVQTTSILTTRSDSRGTRRRITPRNRRQDLIEEITVWYDGVGYEYHIVDGSPFKSFFSRIRLQATPDGTIVQWTMTFELGNLFKRILQGRRYRRQLDKIAVESLRNLRRYVASKGITIDAQHREKTRIKEAPDADARAEYGAKIIATQSTDSEIDEPPIRIEDTPSVPRVVPPSFLAEAIKDVTPLPAPVAEPKEDTRPVKPIPPDHLAALTIPAEEPSPKPVIIEPPINVISDTQPKKPIEVDAVPPNPAMRDDIPPPTGKRDTGQISIWEVFGLERPKDELTKIIDDLKTPSPDAKGTLTIESAAAIALDSPTAIISEGVSTLHATPLDDWLATNEPPIPASASGTMRTIARSSQQARGGLRRIQQQQRLKVRRPLADNEENKKPPQT